MAKGFSMNDSPLTAGIRIAYLIKSSSDDELYQLFEDIVNEINKRKEGGT